MGQSESNKKGQDELVLPKRSFSLEFVVGIFAVASFLALAYLSVGLGGMDLFNSKDSYYVKAQFDNISGLEKGASVEVAGVKIGDVTDIKFKDEDAIAEVTMRIKDVKLREGDIASIRTKGIIGDRYVKITRGSSDEYLSDGATIMDTESVVDIEDLVGKLIHNFTGNDNEDSES